ncbi:cache domain-containing sensor histidine kinase [Paenibacillus rigui]|uniref:Sensor histidine kinase n=1 Tax=Paenibacillus rigui TaxID=554312 RepID=A0A229UTR3_9BACL|nr:sensor histidine kinase [Paenibacillus rigui]OXM86289.1 sensor histidine kinase [Paenibacillus rigui]
MNNPFKKYKIDNLFFRGFAGLMIVVLGCTVWASYGISSKELVKSTSYYQQQLLDELNSEISARLLTIEQISLSTSRDDEVITLLTGKKDDFDRYRRSRSVEQTLANLTYSIPLIQGIDLYMDRPVQGDSKNYIQLRDRSDAAGQVWYPLLQNSDFAWSREHPVPSVQGDVPVLSFIRKIMFDDKYLGILVIHVKADSIKSILAGHSSAADRIMIDAQGQQLLGIGELPKQPELFQWMDELNGQSGSTRTHGKYNMSDSLLVYSKLADSNWTLVEMTPWKQITAGSLRLAEVIGVIGIAAILLTLLLTHWLSRQFTKPIKQLVGAMSSYTVGGSNTELPADYTNEFGYLFSGYRKQNERIEELYLSLQRRHEQQRKAEMEALQANINPHFLYNTLDQLNWMAIAKGQDEMSRILELMGRMFRIGLSNGESFITLEEEVQHVRCYLEIQQLRWGTGLEYAVHSSVPMQQLYLPKLTLQPFVENAIVHGFNTRSEGRIDLYFREEQDRIMITIEDNGVGLQKEPATAAASAKRRTGGYGIRNVKERIAAYFGASYGVKIEERTEGGTRVTVTLPRLQERPAQTHGEQQAAVSNSSDNIITN